jgi:hypothetical protein
MRVFLDFEASSLAKHSYPIEVGWVFEDGAAEDHLIRPAPGWTDWDPDAEAMHGISRERLQAEGAAHDVVARRMLEVLTPHVVYVTAPSWDGMWLSLLLRASGLPRHALRLRDADEAHLEAAAGGRGARGRRPAGGARRARRGDPAPGARRRRRSPGPPPGPRRRPARTRPLARRPPRRRGGGG